MSNEPILLFLHGVGDGDMDDNWKALLTETLARLEYPSLDTAQVIAPKYAHALKGSDDSEDIPGLTIGQSPRGEARKNRRDFERRTGAIEIRLGRHDSGNGLLGGDIFINFALGLPVFEQARNYLQSSEIRARVLNRILATLPEAGRLVIVGHSLGSVIAADLVRRLPVGIEVAGMVTIGSPLANGSFNVDNLRETLKEPPTNLAWWVNFWNAPDPVAALRGVSSVFPWLIDFKIDNKKVGLAAHAAAGYFSNDEVASAVGYALFGSSSKEVAEISKGLDIPLDETELTVLLSLRYAHLIKDTLEGDLQDRYAGALRTVQATVLEDIKRRNGLEHRAIPFALARLSFEPSDPQAMAPEPLPGTHLAKEEAVVLMTILAAESVVRPFEISISRDKRQEAMKDLTAEMGLGSRYGADVFEAAKIAHDKLSDGVDWVRWGILGASAAALVIATGGLALAAAPGLAGAAVLTSALASFGPGGMIGGLLTAGSLVTVGGGGIAYSLASAGTSAAALESVVERKLAATILRQLQDLEPDPTIWRFLTETETAVRREHERLDEFSDESSPSLKELKRKLQTIERALKYLRDNGLEPGVVHKMSASSKDG